MRRASMLVLVLLAALPLIACLPENSDAVQRQQNEALVKEATAQTGMPAIVNFRERKLLKDILELRDQDGLTTYTYTFAEMNGKLTLLCTSVGYGIPYATQYTNPMRQSHGSATLPQADPNGLFSPSSSDATWVMCLDDTTKQARAIYVEPRIVVSPFKLDVQ